MKKLAIIALVLILCIQLTACGETPDESPTPEEEFAFQFGMIYPDPEQGTFTYNGEDIRVGLFLKNGLEPKEIGIQLFVDGERMDFNCQGTKYDFYIAKLKPNEETTIEFMFAPTHGVAGETQLVYFTGIFNPNIESDPEKFIEVGNNVHLMQFQPWKLTFERNAPYSDVNANALTVMSESATDEESSLAFLLNADGLTDKRVNVSGDTLDIVLSAVNSKESCKYRVSVYLDNDIIMLADGNLYADIDILPNYETQLAIPVDTSKLTGVHTLYAIAAPLDGDQALIQTDVLALVAAR
ncbi:hypothetical protein FACS18949_06260 [Clostridia bacterium]|nr:hypothetical protein FACS18949_06260 [Clostridia bacterium]